MGNLIERQIDDKKYADLLMKIGETLDRCVDYGETVLKTIQNHPRNDYVDSSITLLFRDFLEFLDGVATLVKSSCIEASIPILRSMFEQLLSILYILDRHQEDRAASYHVSYIRSRLKNYRKLNRSQIGQLQKTLESNHYSITLPDTDTSESIAQMESLLSKGIYKRINEEWETIKRAKKREPEWYALFNGPKNILELAENQKIIGEYEILYRSWSSKAHATSSFNNLVSSGGIKALRHPESLDMVGTWALSWFFVLIRQIYDFYHRRKQLNFGHFYMQIRNLYLRLSAGEKLVNVIYD